MTGTEKIHTSKITYSASQLLRLSKVVLLLTSLFVSSWVQAKLTANVDAAAVTTEQSLRLVLMSDLVEHSNTSPDFNKLNQDFEILGTSSQTNLQTTGGSMTQTRSWQLELLPKRAGVLTIPAFSLDGDVSEPIEITAIAPKPREPGEGKGDYYMEASVDKTSAYVQSQVLYTLRIYSIQKFLDGSLTELDADGMTAQQLGEARSFQEVIDGRPYQVLEKKYALFAQRSGTYSIAPARMEARVPAPGSNNRGFVTRTQMIRRASEGFTIEVQARPENSGVGWWLPASQFEISSQWEGDISSLRVGDSVTRSLVLRADGVSSSQLPELRRAQSPAYKLYANKPQLEDQAGADGLMGLREEKWALVALRAGELELPEIRVPWFNTTTGATEVAVLPAETLSVLPALQDNAQQTQNANSNQPSTETNIDTQGQGASDGTADSLAIQQENAMLSASLATLTAQVSNWQRMTLAVAGGWLVSLLGLLGYWWYRSRIKSSSALPRRERPTTETLQRVCASGDVQQSAQAMLAWAQAYWPDQPPRTLVALSQRVQSAEVERQLKQLDAQLYAGSSSEGATAELDATALSSLAKRLVTAVELQATPNADSSRPHSISASALPELS